MSQWQPWDIVLAAVIPSLLAIWIGSASLYLCIEGPISLAPTRSKAGPQHTGLHERRGLSCPLSQAGLNGAAGEPRKPHKAKASRECHLLRVGRDA